MFSLIVDELFGSATDPVRAGCEMREWIAACLSCVMARLPVREQMAILCCDVQGLSVKEAARTMGQTVAVVKNLLHAGRTTLDQASAAGCCLVRKRGGFESCDCGQEPRPLLPFENPGSPSADEGWPGLRDRLVHEIAAVLPG